jgi:hypothetical protein
LQQNKTIEENSIVDCAKKANNWLLAIITICCLVFCFWNNISDLRDKKTNKYIVILGMTTDIFASFVILSHTWNGVYQSGLMKFVYILLFKTILMMIIDKLFSKNNNNIKNDDNFIHQMNQYQLNQQQLIQQQLNQQQLNQQQMNQQQMNKSQMNQQQMNQQQLIQQQMNNKI